MKRGEPAAGSPANVTTRPDAPISSHDHAKLWEREEMFWTKGASSARQMTSKDAVFVFPYPAGILQGDALWREKEVAQRWRSIVMSERHVCIRGDIAVLATLRLHSSLQKRTVLIQIGWIELRKFGKLVMVMERDTPVPDSDQPILAKLPQDAVHVDRAQAQGVGKVILRQRAAAPPLCCHGPPA